MSDTKTMPEAGSHASKDHGCYGVQHKKDNEAGQSAQASGSDKSSVEKAGEPSKHHDSGECCCGSKQTKS